jgi:hypothetical protein
LQHFKENSYDGNKTMEDSEWFFAILRRPSVAMVTENLRLNMLLQRL